MRINIVAILCSLFSVHSAIAFENPKSFQCIKSGDSLSLTIGHHLGDGPTFYGIRLNGNTNEKALAVFNEILQNAEKSTVCTDLSDYAVTRRGEVLLCKGEMFVPTAAYGKVILTNGSVKVFKNILAPISGWDCQ